MDVTSPSARQRLLAHPRRIAPTRHKLARRPRRVIVELQNRLAIPTSFLPCSVNAIPLQSQAPTSTFAATAQMRPLSPQDLDPGVEGEVDVDHAVWTCVRRERPELLVVAAKAEVRLDLQVNQHRHRPIRSKHSHRSQIVFPILIPSLCHIHPTKE